MWIMLSAFAGEPEFSGKRAHFTPVDQPSAFSPFPLSWTNCRDRTQTTRVQ